MKKLPVNLDANSHYNVLGVSTADSVEEIRNDTKIYLNKLHPDNSQYDITNDEYQKVKDAVNTLTDEEKRSEYDSNKTQLSAETNSDELPVCVGNEITISVSEQNGSTTQYEVDVEGNTYKTDGDGCVDIEFSTAGEKQVIINKRDRGTNRYVPDSLVIPVVSSKNVQLDMQLRQINGQKIQRNVKAGTKVIIKVINADTGQEIPNADVEHGNKSVTTGTDGKAQIELKSGVGESITCKKEPKNNKNFIKKEKEINVLKKRKKLSIDINTKEVCTGGVLEFTTITEDGETEPFVDIILKQNNTELTYQSDSNGYFSTTVSQPGKITIQLEKEETDTATYFPNEHKIYALDTNQLNVSVDTSTNSEENDVCKIYVNVMLDKSSTAGNVTIKLNDPTKYANGATIKSIETYITNSERETFTVNENGVYGITVNGDKYEKIKEEIRITDIDKNPTAKHGKNILKKLTRPGISLSNTLTGNDTNTPKRQTSKIARVGIVFLWAFSLAGGISTMTTTGNIQLWGAVTGVVYILPMVSSKTGAWCYAILIPQIPRLQNELQFYQELENPFLIASGIVLLPFTISIIHYAIKNR